MRKAFKYISSVSMWLAVAALWAHMIIPHDHHIIEAFADEEQNCPASNHKSGHNSKFPIHCHAFNDLASEKARVYHISQNIQDGFNALFTLPNNFISEPQFSFSGINDFQTTFLSSCTHNFYLLRAPPSLA
ncbi:MAG: hypothetical protein NT092_03365 [Bacteroidia bacterium]|nr:hypothetical protein [Bacteroidia bacterium]